ncbi:MAG: hypothetical protein IT439_07075, partial [Phycisphaerales bacterium]|nr:hypothetical protein [Phycisphaerales bacterium]
LSAASLLPDNLPAAWQGGAASALAVATSLSQTAGATLPWKTVRDAIAGALQARFVELTDDSGKWPCDLVAAKAVRIKVASAPPPGGGSGPTGGRRPVATNIRSAEAEFEPSQLQDLGDAVPRLLDIKAKTNVSLRFHVRLEIGDGSTAVDPAVIAEINKALESVAGTFRLE